MNLQRRLIVNADDFGLSPGINRGILHAHAHGIVTSTSLMVRGPAAREGVAEARTHPGLTLGIHVDLAEWEFKDGEWKTVYEVVPLNDDSRIELEVRRQLEVFHELVGRKPSHIDSHQHLHLQEPRLSVFRNASEALGVPLRGVTPGLHHCGRFYGQSSEGAPLHDLLSVAFIERLLDGLPEGRSELACHPAAEVDFVSIYANERLLELEVLCDPRLRASLASRAIELAAF